MTESEPTDDLCTITVDAGADVSVCATGGTVSLNGSVMGNALQFFWTPSTGLSNPNSLTPLVTTAMPQTYTLNAQQVDNLIPIPNGDFELGNTNFSSDYNYIDPGNPIGFLSPGAYTTITSPALIWSNLPPCDDHTLGNGTGQSMVINGNGIVGENVWCTTLAASPNTDYYFSAWVTTLNPLFPPQLQITVNGNPVGTTFNAGGTPCNWEPFGAAFNSGAATSVNICLSNQNSGNGFLGNDFALDDMELSSVCTETDEVMVTILNPVAQIASPDLINCNAADLCVTLNGAALNPQGMVAYQWTASNGGSIQSGGMSASPEICNTGDYSLVVTETVGTQTCDSAPITTSVTDNMAFPPMPVIDGPIEICQGIPESFSVISDPAYTTINWLESSGMTIISGQGTNAVDVVFVSNTIADICVQVENNCANLEQNCFPINVSQSPVAPVMSGPLNVCDQINPVYNIDNFDPAVLNYTWTATGGGQVIDGQGTSTVVLDWNGALGNQQLCATPDNLCGVGGTTCIDIEVSPQTIVTNINLTTLDPSEVGVVQILYPSSTGCDSLVITTTTLIANLCNISVDAGPDVTICANAGPVQLSGFVNGNNVAGFEWTPTTGLSDPTSLNPTATITTTTTYTLTGQSVDDANLIQNGGFEQGNVLFTSDYMFENCPTNPFGTLGCEGAYTITSNAAATHTNFSPCTGNSSPLFMAVNGAQNLQNVWCQQITVSPNTLYQFSAWATSIEGTSPAILQFSINGSPIGDLFSVSSATCNWQQFSSTWNSGSITSANICVLNQNTAVGGNDFGLDDIGFFEVCEASDEVPINVHDIDALIDPPAIIDCNLANNCIQLNGANSFTNSGNGLTYNWLASNGGIIQSGSNTANPTVCTGGTYTLEVSTVAADGTVCTSEMTSINVFENNTLPIEPFITGEDLLCPGDIELYFIDPNPAYTSITWFDPTNGTILGSNNSEQVFVEWTGLNAGQICVQVANNCGLLSNLTCFNVQVEDLPAVPIVTGNDLICNFETGFYNASVATPGINNYTWTVPLDAQIVQGSGTDNIVIDWTNSAGGEVCVDVANDCGTNANCMTVVVHGLLTEVLDTTLCSGATFNLNGTIYGNGNLSGVEVFTYPDGCDSLILTVSVAESDAIINNQSLSICDGESIMVGTQAYSTSGTYRDTFQTTLACDSIVITDLIVTNVEVQNLNLTTCDASAVGVDSVLLQNIFGCDSLVITTTSLLPSNQIAVFETTCDINQVGV
ncbi:MAG: hypothetical protein AAF985_03755, partial [Bacteroidota bacterium]